MRIIYADILIVINLAVDYLVLFGTARLAGTQFLRLRALVAAVSIAESSKYTTPFLSKNAFGCATKETSSIKPEKTNPHR